MSSSDDDMPIIKAQKGNHRMDVDKPPLSRDTIPHNLDAALDKEIPSGKEVHPAASLHNLPFEQIEADGPAGHGARGKPAVSAKRKERHSITNGESSRKVNGSDNENHTTQPSHKRRRTLPAKSIQQKDQVSASDSEDEPIVARKSARQNQRFSNADKMILDSSDGDVPLAKKIAQKNEEIEKDAEKEAKAIRKAEKEEKAASASAKKATQARKKQKEEDSSDDEPISKGKNKSTNGPTKTANAKSKQAPKKVKDEDDEKPTKVAGKAQTSKAKPATPAKKPKPKAALKEELEEDAEAAQAEEDEYRWWEDPTKGDGTTKWKTLEHSGVVFPPPYEPLPSNVKMIYDGAPVTLHPDAEEVAGFFGAMLNSTHNVENPTFIKNFFHDFQEVLDASGGAKDKDGRKIKIKDFAKCDFTPIFDYYEGKRAEKKALPAAEKKRLKAEKDAAEAPYMYCLWDGRKERVGNFRVEPPGLFRGRGEHPKTGHLKKRVLPEQITINIGKEATVPAPPEGHKWKEVRHDQTGTWLAMWQENINNAYKYVMLAANSTIKGQSDYNKFEKARELKKHIDRIRSDYKKGLKAELMADRQKATAVYLIDHLALRAGNEKGEDEAETVGCCSLKYENVTLKPPRTVILDFLGKDSIRFYNEVEVDEQVFKNLKIFKKAPKSEGDDIFDRLTTSQLNAHLSSYMRGLTAKVFRTYNASYTMSKLLQDMKSRGSVAENVKGYNDANREVAILCNHKRTIPTSHAGQMEKMSDKVKGLKYQKWRIKQMMIDIDPKIKKKKGADFFRLDDDLDEDWILQHQAFLVEEQRQKIEKKFQKDNEKLVAEGEKEMKTKELEERLKVAHELEKKFQKENKTKKIEAEGKGPTIEKMEANLDKVDKRIEAMLLQVEDKESNKEVALGTSKINYIDPRLTVVFSKKFNVPIEKFFSKTLREKFDWAIKSVDENWQF